MIAIIHEEPGALDALHKVLEHVRLTGRPAVELTLAPGEVGGLKPPVPEPLDSPAAMEVPVRRVVRRKKVQPVGGGRPLNPQDGAAAQILRVLAEEKKPMSPLELGEKVAVKTQTIYATASALAKQKKLLKVQAGDGTVRYRLP